MSSTMAWLIKVTAQLLGLLFPGKGRAALEAVGSITILGLINGYRWSTITWLIKQSYLETGGWSNRGTSEDLNVWGMSRVLRRTTTQVGWRRINENETSGQYSSIWDSCRDRFMWDDRFGLDGRSSVEAYAAAVGAVYHASDHYADQVGAVSSDHWRNMQRAWLIVLPIELTLVVYGIRKFI